MSDLHVVDYLTGTGISLEDARDHLYHACVYPLSLNKIWGRTAGPVNAALNLDMTLHNGVAWVTGKRIGLETGNPRSFKNFGELLEAFKKQHEFIMKKILWLGSLSWAEGSRYIRLPLMSSLLPGCVETGQDSLCGGLEQGFATSVMDRAIVDAADSLMSIKKLVFDEERLTMDELLEALDSNFDGERGMEIWQMCLAAPKFGNDVDEADHVVRELGSLSAHIAEADKYPDGVRWTIYRNGVAWHYTGGKAVGALPNGRKAGEPLNDGSISPMRGQDKTGITAVLRSVFKAEFKESVTTVLNQKFSAALMKSPDGRDKLADLTDTFMKNGGQHIQYNLVDAQTLHSAQKDPEKHRDLVVRIGGFSAYFVHLTQEVQEDVITRSEQGL